MDDKTMENHTKYENRIDIDIEPPTHIDILLNIEY